MDLATNRTSAPLVKTSTRTIEPKSATLTINITASTTTDGSSKNRT
jgi:hypothetical protein